MSETGLTSERLAQAFALAEELHRGQKRKGSGIPYLSHLMAVAALVQEHGGSEDQVIAALLHDGPEDRGGEKTLEMIRRRFGEDVACIVEECSDTFETPKPPWLRRKKEYLEHLPKASAETLLVSVADKVHNVGAIVRDYKELGEEVWERFTADREQVVWYYDSLLQTYRSHNEPQIDRLTAELGQLLQELRALIAASPARN